MLERQFERSWLISPAINFNRRGARIFYGIGGADWLLVAEEKKPPLLSRAYV